MRCNGIAFHSPFTRSVSATFRPSIRPACIPIPGTVRCSRPQVMICPCLPTLCAITIGSGDDCHRTLACATGQAPWPKPCRLASSAYQTLERCAHSRHSAKDYSVSRPTQQQPLSLRRALVTCNTARLLISQVHSDRKAHRALMANITCLFIFVRHLMFLRLILRA